MAKDDLEAIRASLDVREAMCARLNLGDKDALAKSASPVLAGAVDARVHPRQLSLLKTPNGDLLTTSNHDVFSFVFAERASVMEQALMQGPRSITRCGAHRAQRPDVPRVPLARRL
jgi:hypothetical protein